MFTDQELRIFVHTAQLGGLTRAAHSLGLLTATASASLKRLEGVLGARMFERSPRSMRLTPQGERFLRYCQEGLALLDQGVAAVADNSGKMAGLLRISAPSDLGRNVLLPWVSEFQSLHPGLKINLQCSDHFVDVFQDPFDMMFRHGRLADSSYVTQSLGPNRRIVVASPAYLARHGTPRTLEDLASHNCLIHSLESIAFNVWRFKQGRKAVSLKVFGDHMSDDGAIVHAWALGGQGIAYKSALDVHADLRAGRLVQLLPQLLGEEWVPRVVYPHRSSISATARALTAHVRQRIEALNMPSTIKSVG